SSAVVEANFDWTIIRVDTDEDVHGYGEAFFNVGLPAMVREFGELLRGEDPLNVEPLTARMRGAPSAEQASHPISGIGTAPRALARAARSAVAMGYTALKFDRDVPTPGVDADPHARALAPAQLDHLVSLVDAVVNAVPRGVDVAFDCHWRLNVRDAVRLATA